MVQREGKEREGEILCLADIREQGTVDVQQAGESSAVAGSSTKGAGLLGKSAKSAAESLEESSESTRGGARQVSRYCRALKCALRFEEQLVGPCSRWCPIKAGGCGSRLFPYSSSK